MQGSRTAVLGDSGVRSAVRGTTGIGGGAEAEAGAQGVSETGLLVAEAGAGAFRGEAALEAHVLLYIAKTKYTLILCTHR